jgi:transposase
MQYKQGQDRSQVYLTSLEEMVPPDSFARVIDLMVDSLPLEELGFTHATLNKEGNEPYHPADLLKLLIYGQRHGIRSANKLHAACKINVEVMWLLKGLQPSARTICYFRTYNAEAIVQAHKHFVKQLKKWKLIDGTLLALDSTKVRGQNSLKNNFNQKKINRHLEYLDGRIEEYLSKIKKVEDKGSTQQKTDLENKIHQAYDRVVFYKQMEQQVKQSNDGQVSTTDPDARAVIKHRNIVEVGYNIQTTVDARHNLIVDTFAGGVNDRSDLAIAAKRSQDLLCESRIDLLADKGYHNGADIAYCERKGVRTFIPPSNPHHQKPEGFRKSDFEYDPSTDTYICPDGQTLAVELIYKKKNNRRNYRVKRYGTPLCHGCPLRQNCSTSIHGRKIERPNHQAHVERNNGRVRRYPNYFRMRQQIVEPIFGVWKRQWHFDHLMLRTKQNVEAEVSLAAITYNLMRLVSVKGRKWVENRLKKLYFDKIIPVGINRLSQWMNDIIKIIGIHRLQVDLRPNPGVLVGVVA